MFEAMPSLVEGVLERGFAVALEALPAPVIQALRERAQALDAQRLLRPARIGRGDARDRRADIRGDRIHWLDDAPELAAEVALANFLGDVRGACNRALLLGLVDFEGHYALYPPGSFYARHRDRFRDDDRRVLSFALYLNERWDPRDGGALRLFVGDAGTIEVAPRGGTMVVFLSADFDHEVLPTVTPRWSLTGWFRRRATRFG